MEVVEICFLQLKLEQQKQNKQLTEGSGLDEESEA